MAFIVPSSHIVYILYLVVGWERRINIELIRHDRYIESVDH